MKKEFSPLFAEGLAYSSLYRIRENISDSLDVNITLCEYLDYYVVEYSYLTAKCIITGEEYRDTIDVKVSKEYNNLVWSIYCLDEAVNKLIGKFPDLEFDSILGEAMTAGCDAYHKIHEEN